MKLSERGPVMAVVAFHRATSVAILFVPASAYSLPTEFLPTHRLRVRGFCLLLLLPLLFFLSALEPNEYFGTIVNATVFTARIPSLRAYRLDRSPSTSVEI